MSRRGEFDMKSLTAKKARMDAKVASQSADQPTRGNPYLSTPVQPEKALQMFLIQVRSAARKYLPRESQQFPITKPFCEVEARLGILKVPHSSRRITSSGAKHVQGQLAQAFQCNHQQQRAPSLLSGVSRSHYVRWTAGGISEPSPLSQALGVSSTESKVLKEKLVETEMVETVYTGYAQERRACFPGYHPAAASNGKMEYKERLALMDLTLPAAHYDLRIGLSSEKVVDHNVGSVPPNGWTRKRVKRRRSYTRRDKSFAWQVDVTEVTTTHKDSNQHAEVDYEIEVELRESVLLQLINEQNEEKVKEMTSALASQLWWMISQINPLADALDVEESLRDHPNRDAVQLALAQCGALRRYMDSSSGGQYDSPIGKSQPPPAALSNLNFPGCMPVNFSRHNIEEIQRSPDNAYFLSEKTDGVRHFLIFTGGTAVLVDRAMRGKQPIPTGDPSKDPFTPILDLIQPGTVLDGEVVMNHRRGSKPRPIFIVFDVMTISTSEPVLQLSFEQRLKHLKRATFRTPTAARDMFDPKAVADPSIALPLVRKNFVKRTDLDELLSHVKEERGMRCYRNGELHNHLTDGIIFQPNLPYVCGTDVNLLKWKYLDTVTIDVELLPLRPSDDDDTLRVGCLGEEETRVDMTRYVLLPPSERMRLEADRFESGGQIAEVGFDPETGEWYYLTMRSDKKTPNHISTVLGTLLELAESLTTDELRYRMSIPAGSRDTYRKDMHGMLKQLLEHQRRRLRAPRPNGN